MKLLFSGGSELVTLDINREHKKLIITSAQTGGLPKEVPFSFLFDKGKEKQQEEETDKLPNNQFKIVIIVAMKKAGYTIMGR